MKKAELKITTTSKKSEKAANTREWSLNVSSDKIKISKVIFHLHPTFFPNKFTKTQEPFTIAKGGWGSFTVRIEVEYDNTHSEFEYDLDIFHNSKETVKVPIQEGPIIIPEKKPVIKEVQEKKKVNEEGFLIIHNPKWIVLPPGFEDDCRETEKELSNDQLIHNLESEFNLVGVIGKGANAKVYNALWKAKDNMQVAIKRISVRNLSVDTSGPFLNEIKMHHGLKHKNIVQFYAASLKKPHFCIVMELMEKSLSTHLYNNLTQSKIEAIDWNVRLQYCLDICEGLEYIHQCKLIHRDLKSMNILMSPDGVCKISDFGTCVPMEIENKVKKGDSGFVYRGKQVGSPLWMSPESIAKEPLTDRADVYSFGVVINEIISNKLPYKNLDMMEFEDIMKDVLLKGLRPDIGDHVKEHCQPMCSLLESMWKKDPTERPDCASIKKILVEIKEKNFNVIMPNELSKSSSLIIEKQVSNQLNQSGNVFEKIDTNEKYKLGRKESDIPTFRKMLFFLPQNEDHSYNLTEELCYIVGCDRERLNILYSDSFGRRLTNPDLVYYATLLAFCLAKIFTSKAKKEEYEPFLQKVDKKDWFKDVEKILFSQLKERGQLVGLNKSGSFKSFVSKFCKIMKQNITTFQPNDIIYQRLLTKINKL